MTDHADFLREIIAAPDDDAPRLIYADWLDEQNDPRGEFIRVQREKERTPWHEPRFIELEDRERWLLAQFGGEWTKQLPEVNGVAWGLADIRLSPEADLTPRLFRRGFAEAGTVRRVGPLLRNAEQLLGQTLLREIRLGELSPENFDRWINSAWAEKLRGLYFNVPSFRPVGDFRVVTDSPLPERLRYLSLAGGRQLQPMDIEALSNAAWPHLRQLNLSACGIGPEPLPPQLVEWNVLPRLDALILTGNRGTNWASLFAPGRISQLHALDLWGCGLDRSALEALGQAKLHRLTHLTLACNDIRGSAIAELFRAAAFPALRVLSLFNTDFGDRAATTVAECPALATLQSLYLGETPLTNRGVSALVRSPHIAQLRRLSLLKVAADDEAVNALVESPYLTRLEYLNTQGAQFSRDGLSRLKKRFGKKVVQNKAFP